MHTVVRCRLRLDGLPNIYDLPDGALVYADTVDLQLPDGHVVLCKSATGIRMYIINLHLERDVSTDRIESTVGAESNDYDQPTKAGYYKV